MALKSELKQVQQNAVGLTMTFQTKTSLLDTTSMKLIMKIGSNKIEKDLTEGNITDPATGEVKYITQQGDLAVPGKYTCQLIDNTEGVYLPSKKFQFEVVANVE